MIAQSMLIQPPKNEAEIKEIKELSAIFGDKNIKIITPSGYQIEIPYSILSLFKTVIETLNNGDALTIIPMHKELTTQQAADILNVSRPYFIKLLENGEISFNKVGRHRRISMLDLLEYKNKRDKIRKENLDELSKLGQDLGLYD